MLANTAARQRAAGPASRFETGRTLGNRLSDIPPSTLKNPESGGRFSEKNMLQQDFDPIPSGPSD